MTTYLALFAALLLIIAGGAHVDGHHADDIDRRHATEQARRTEERA